MPGDFPLAVYNALHELVKARTGVDTKWPPYYSIYASASNSVALRFRALAEEVDAYAVARRGGDAEHRFLQEKAQFNFFANALACLECTTLNLYILGHWVRPTSFPMTKVWTLDPFSELDVFTREFPGGPVTKALGALAAHSNFRTLRAARNHPMHRGTPGRNFFMGGPNDRKELWTVEDERGPITLDAASDLLGDLRKWVADSLQQLLESARDTVQRHVAPPRSVP